MGTALVTGVTGQLGYFVAEQLAKRGDTVWGLVRQSTIGRGACDRELPYRPVTGDLLDEYSLLSILEEVRPDRIFNFGAQSFIPASWTQPILTAQYTGLGVVRLLEAVRRARPGCRVLQAGSSELFAGAESSPQDESAPIRPLNPYGIAKAFAFHTVRAYRAQYRQFATNAVFFTLNNLFKLYPYIASGLITVETLKADVRFVPFIPLGVVVGWGLNRVVPQKAFVYLVYGLLIVTSLQLLRG